jgi:hypothetical protein
LKLRHGVRAHDTFSTVFRVLDPKALDAAFGRLSTTPAAALAKRGVIAIDGKSPKGASRERREEITEIDVGLRYWPAPRACHGGG